MDRSLVPIARSRQVDLRVSLDTPSLVPELARTVCGLALAATSLGFAVVQLDVSVVNVAIQPIRFVQFTAASSFAATSTVGGLRLALVVAIALVAITVPVATLVDGTTS